MKKIYFVIIILASLFLLTNCSNRLYKNKVNKSCREYVQNNKRIVIILSADGFRADYINHARTPNIDSIIKVGTSGALQPSYPSQTFPNHYTLATGLYPNHHGIVSNSFYDKELGEYSIANKKTSNNGKFYGGEPIWNTVHKYNKRTIVYYWVGSEAAINGRHPDIWFKYNSHIPFTQRADYIFNEINKGGKNQPDLAMLYIEEPDKAGHHNGASSPKTYKKVEEVDKFIGYILNKIRQSPYRDNIDFILVSDHGMATIKNQIRLLDYVKPYELSHYVTGAICQLYLKDTTKIENILSRFKNIKSIKAYKKQDIPAHLNYGSNPRIGDIVIIPNVGTYVYYNHKSHLKGTHGYDNSAREMRAIFVCFGPDFKKGRKLYKDIPNVNIYPLICKILNIKPSKCDGEKYIVNKILK